MENVVNQGFWKGKRVFITGHSGFKGAWLTLWLKRLGAEITGYSLDAPTRPSLYELTDIKDGINDVRADIRDFTSIRKALVTHRPEIIFHLAAQALVRRSYRDPIETYSTNIMGTVNLLEAVRQVGGVKAIVNVTSDKCYENREWVWGYRESDPMGGYDPYSSSKGCAELVTAAYRNSYFHVSDYHIHGVALASVRAGNVIGGGDWGEDRLVPDIVRAIQNQGRVTIRNPKACRPWQHVLEPLSGYLLLGRRLFEGGTECAQGWNFGPRENEMLSVAEIVKRFKSNWDVFSYEFQSEQDQPHEAGLLKLDCSLAWQKLGWRPIWTAETAINKTVDWYKSFYEEDEILCNKHIQDYISETG